MAKPVKTHEIPIPLLGVNGRLTDAKPGNFAEGFDVFDDGDGLGRRPYVFKGIAASGMFFYPAARTVVLDQNQAVVSTRRLTWSAGSPNPTVYYVGVDELFDGFHLPLFTSEVDMGTTAAGPVEMEVHYWNGTAWTLIPWFLDTTTEYQSASPYLSSTMARWGAVHWRRTQLTGWALSTIAANSLYWIRFRMIRRGTPGTGIAGFIEQTALQPGIRAFRRAPINGLFYHQMNDRRTILIGSDRHPPRGAEKGAMLNALFPGLPHTEELQLTIHSSSGLYDVVDMPQAHISTAGPSVAGTQGAAGRLTDQALSPIRFAQRIEVGGEAGGTPDQNITPIAPFSTSTVVTSHLPLANAFQAGDLESFIILCIDRAGAGPLVGEHRTIARHQRSAGTTTFTVGSAWSAAPNGSNRFQILAPRDRIVIEQVLVEESTREISFPAWDYWAGASGLITMFNDDIDDAYAGDWLLTGQAVHFRRSQQLRWTLPSGRRWRGAVDSTTKEILLLNGGIPFTYDSYELRKLVADYNSITAQTAIGQMEDQLNEELEEDEDPVRLDPKTVLRVEPPGGDFITDWAGHIWIARDQRVYWSMALGANNIWPYGNEAQIRDKFGDAITGLIPYGNRLIVSTPTALHQIVPVGPSFAAQPICQGIGFVSSDAVDYVSAQGGLALMGVTREGVYTLTEGQPTPVISDWRAIEPNGVNVQRLHKAVAAAWNARFAFVFAYPSAGSDVNDRFCWIDIKEKRLWVWRHPDGITGLCVVPSSTGKDVLLIGTEAGIVETLVIGDTDDGRTVTGYFKTHSIDMKAKHFNIYRTNVVVDALGASQTVELRLYRDGAKTPAYQAALPAALGLAQYGTAVYGTDRYAEGQSKTFCYGIPAGIKSGEISLEMRGTARWLLRAWNFEMRQFESGRK